MARTSVATDNFNRGSLGSNWTQTNTTQAGNLIISSSTVADGSYSMQPTGNLASARWTGAGSFTDDQYASVVVASFTNNGGANSANGVTVCNSGANATRSCYEAYVIQNSTTTPTVVLAKWVNGTRTQLHSATTSWSGNASRIELEREGTTIRVMKDGTALGGSYTQTDSDLSGGTPGLSCTSGATGDNWEGGNIGSSGVARLVGGKLTHSILLGAIA